MTHIILTCLFPFAGSFQGVKYPVDAILIEKLPGYYIVDISAAADKLSITGTMDGQSFSRYRMPTDSCYSKTDINMIQRPVNTTLLAERNID